MRIFKYPLSPGNRSDWAKARIFVVHDGKRGLR